MAANRYKSCPPPSPSLVDTIVEFISTVREKRHISRVRWGEEKIMRCNGYLYGRLVFRQIDHACGVNDMDGSCEIRSDSMVLFFFFPLSPRFFFPSLPPSLFSSAMLRRIFDDRFEQGWNGSRVEWEMGIWMSDLEISSFSIRVKYEKNLSKWFFSFFFFVFACCATFFSFFIYLWIWFIGTSNISLQLVIISISQCCRKFTTFYLIKFVI